MFVTERSGETLKYYLIDQPGNCPSVNPLSTLGVIQWAEQIVDALIAIHSMFKGCVHGDLRLENVLVKYFIFIIMNLQLLCNKRMIALLKLHFCQPGPHSRSISQCL